MNLFRLLQVAALAFTASIALPLLAHAQLTPVASITVGGAHTTGGEYDGRTNPMGELFVGIRKHSSSRISPIGGAYVGTAEWRGGVDTRCRIAPGGGCVPIIPNFHYAGVAAGVEIPHKVVTVAAMLGPGLVIAHEVSGPVSSATVFGALARADLWFRAVKHLEFGGSLSSRIMPSFRHDALYINAVNTGIRVQF